MDKKFCRIYPMWRMWNRCCAEETQH